MKNNEVWRQKITGIGVNYLFLISQQTDAVAEYLEENTNQRVGDFIEELEELIFKKIPQFPFSHPEFLKMTSENQRYRKAIFKKKWNIIYQVTEGSIVYIYLYHSSRNLDNLEL